MIVIVYTDTPLNITSTTIPSSQTFMDDDCSYLFIPAKKEVVIEPFYQKKMSFILDIKQRLVYNEMFYHHFDIDYG